MKELDFIDYDISLKSGDVLVSREWGASNFPKFLEQAQELGYTIEQVQ